jgi:hypothetical protein
MKNLTYFFFLIPFAIISPKLFSQLDSVYYKGPSQGSVSGGAIQTTDIFPAHLTLSSNEEKIGAPLFQGNDINKNMIMGWNKSDLPEYRYIEDNHVDNNNSGTGDQTILLNTFPGIGMTNYIPPDPVIAAGPEHLIICSNSLFKILDKEGTVLKTISAVGWWAPVWPDENGDPQVIYDHYANRWVLVWMQVNSSALTSGNLVAYSDDENPLGTWYMYRLDTKKHGTVSSNTWGDYPHVGYDEEALYISTGCTDFAGGGHQYNKIRIINKSELYNSNGGPLTYTDFWELHVPGQGSQSDTLDYIQPAISYTPGNGGWSFWAKGVYNGSMVSADFYAIYKIINPLTSPYVRGKVLPVQTYTSPPLANQLGGGLGIETIGWITRQPVTRDGFLYTSHDIQNSVYPAYSSVKYLKIDLNSVSITENVEYGSQGYFYLFPALTIDKDHNIAITFSRSADNEYIGAYYTTWHANDPAGFNPSLPYAEGMGNYVLTYGGSLNRWGDYFGIYLDPANDYDIWMLSEYAAATNIWSTYVGRIRMAPYPGAHVFINPHSIDFGNVEIGTSSSTSSIVLANYGDADLVISNIPSSIGDFNLVTTLSFPVTLSSYDSLSLQFNYTPSVVGSTSVLYNFTTNDPDFQGISLSGNCYQIVPAIEKTIYASSGVENDGNILTINPQTGAGSVIGQSFYPEVKGLAINPLTGIIYGLETYSSPAEIIRVNSEYGDSYSLFPVNIPSIADIAFDTLGTLYGIGVNGELYTIDLSNGDLSFVVDAIGSYSGITFNPQTNELWATSRSFLPPNKDAVFKVNISTGDTTIVGHTGLNQLTNDLVFDENLNLYGVIGIASELNDFISINPNNGSGTIIGSVGMKNILGLAYLGSSPTSVENNADNFPSEYELFQNYPNPFNPSTKIEFRIAELGLITLKVYDVLGNELMTLVNEQKQAGNYEVEFNASSLTSGVYFYQLKSGNLTQTKKMVLLK